MEIGLGDDAKDGITGFRGIVVADTTWLNGCRRLVLQPTKLDKDGKPRPSETFDVEQLVLVKRGERGKSRVEAPPRKVGGPNPAPVGHAVPRR